MRYDKETQYMSKASNHVKVCKFLGIILLCKSNNTQIPRVSLTTAGTAAVQSHQRSAKPARKDIPAPST